MSSRSRVRSKRSGNRRRTSNKARTPAAARVFVVSAPSGAGKTTLCQRLLREFGPRGGLADSVSMTTRAPRPGEKRGVDYRFVSRRQFEAVIRRRGFLEYEENFGNFYGTPRRFVDDSLARGVSVLLSIDVKGAMKVRRAYRKRAVLIFIMPPSVRALKERLTGRMSDSRESIERRLKLAKREMSYRKRYDHVVVNDDLDRAYRRLKKIIVNGSKEPYPCNTRSA